MAKLGDGWLASAYNTSPIDFDAAPMLSWPSSSTAEGRDAASFPNTLVTMWMFITEDPSERIAMIGRLAEFLRS